ncbi:hypothetical protein [Streptomyces coeruleorubidus]|uniref:Uncharacterized protein n=1 Tax=Streptomyces coeruleorubidus TaxID=116188 RepID=A0A5J6I050_STRC4|nr:hypothetical protein [Streptomyces coeruleorubidus]QEV23970.1 hypothetical protein CP976_07300 [Streptomyces coeruleorubidus]GGT85729.1 hypothetical protein GCM10010256_52310 [Streptomyces coeruleorubidus]
MPRTYRWKAAVSDGRHHDGESVGTVRAGSEAEARRLVADWVREDGARKNRSWTATHIELS